MARSFGRGNRIRQAADTQRDMNSAASTDESDARARRERALKEVRDHASTVFAFVHRSQRAWQSWTGTFFDSSPWQQDARAAMELADVKQSGIRWLFFRVSV